MLLHAQKTDRKFRFVDDFEDEDFEEGFLEEYEKEGPELKQTKFFGMKELHQIARVDWKEVEIILEKEEVKPDGRTEVKEEKVTYYQEVRGELGGWLEIESNLSQDGDCWVEPDGYVMGEARVCDDAVVSGGAEVGGSAFVCGEAEIKGPVGIGGRAKVCDKAKVTGSARLAVFGAAEVVGESEIGESAKVYGKARVGSNTLVWGLYKKYKNPIVKGRARVYGSALILGSVYGNAEVYGRSTIYGWAYEDAHVGGTAVVWATGQVFGKVRLLKGDVYGNLSGENVEILYPRFYLGEASTFIAKAFEKSNEEDKYDGLSANEKDKIEDRETKRYGGDVRSLVIKEGCRIENCEFGGDVKLYGCKLNNCKVYDSILGERTGESTSVGSYVIYGWSYAPIHYWTTLNFYADSCTFKKSLIPSGDLSGSTFEGCIASRGIQYTNDVYYETAKNISGCNLKNTVLLKNCLGLYDCRLEDVTVDATSMKRETLSNCGIIQTQGGVSFGVFSLRFLGDLSSKHVLLVKPGQYKNILGTNKWGNVRGVKELGRIASYVMRFDGVPEMLFFDSDMTYTYELFDEHTKFANRLDKSTEERKKWFDDLLSDMQDELMKMQKENKWDEYVAKKRLQSYLAGLASIGWGILSEASFNRIKQAVEKTISSFDGVTFTPLVDYGELEMEATLKEFEKKYGISTTIPVIA